MSFKEFLFKITRIKSWWKLPTYAALYYLSMERDHLLSHNLFDSYTGDMADFPNATCSSQDIAARTLSGKCNNLTSPGMGMVGYRMGRNLPFRDDYEDTKNFLTPNPREVANKLLVREKFIPATSINLFVAAWIQFQVHDWFSHGRDTNISDLFQVPLPADDRWRAEGYSVIYIPRTVNDTKPNDDLSLPTTFSDVNTHWWDVSQLYGTDPELHSKLRTFVDGKLKVDKDNLLPVDADGIELTGFKLNWWLGLSLMHNLYTREHNAICDHLKKSHPDFTDQQLFDKARMVLSAVNAKIHTIEWTPAILWNDVGRIALRSNWFGLKNVVPRPLSWLVKLAGRLGILSSETVDGIIGHPPNFANVPFSLTEEFVSVYRFHSLLPDQITLVDAKSGLETGTVYPLLDTTFSRATKLTHTHPFKDLVATFGTSNPGALTLHNFPAFLTNITLPNDNPLIHIDMATTDLLRDRERGVARFNEFRKALYLKPVKTFEDINPDPKVANELKEVYGDVDKVDLLVGCLAEQPRPEGFAFGDTTFHIFILMASRRLMTDRFFTSDFTAEYYTEEGLEWVKNTGFKEMILRAEPSLAVFLNSVENPFQPWEYGKVFTPKKTSWITYIVAAVAVVVAVLVGARVLL